MKSIIKDAIILFLITAIAGLLLAFVNEITKTPINEQKEKAKIEACNAVFEDAFTFEDDVEIIQNSSIAQMFNTKYPKITVDQVYKAKDEAGNVLGYVITLTTKEGYGGEITFSMGIRLDRTLNGISILSSSETVGLGLRASEVLVPQFAGKNVESFTYTKTGSVLDSEIDAISSATITTNAFVNCVNAGLDYFDSNLKSN